ncbi:MAG TPA: hypothetical protein VI141_08165 [Acidimicrobiia bacterium]
MLKRMLGVFTAVVAALAVVGVAWASSDDGSTGVTTAGSDDSATSSSVTSPSTPTTSEDDSTSTSSGGGTVASTPTTLDDDSTVTSVAGGATTSTSLGTTSTSQGGSTSTSLDDHGGDRATVPDGRSTHAIPGVGSVTIEARAGRLVLVDVSAPGWSIEHDKIEPDRIELEFTSGEAEAEFEARIEGNEVRVEVEVDSD